MSGLTIKDLITWHRDLALNLRLKGVDRVPFERQIRYLDSIEFHESAVKLLAEAAHMPA